MSPRELMRPLVATLSIASAIFPVAGCAAQGTASSSDPESASLAAAGDDSLQTETNLEAVARSFVGDSSGGISIQSAGALSPPRALGGIMPDGIVADPAGGFYQPAGCLVED